MIEPEIDRVYQDADGNEFEVKSFCGDLVTGYPVGGTERGLLKTITREEFDHRFFSISDPTRLL
ncbi:MAG: hypothetical protein AAF384_19685 [Pseudomonadota bacterium]